MTPSRRSSATAMLPMTGAMTSHNIKRIPVKIPTAASPAESFGKW